MLIPSPLEIRDAIASIAFGQTQTVAQLKQQLAKKHGAGCVCPFMTNKGWKLVALAAEEDGSDARTPWWRLTVDGKPNPKLPGGAEAHQALLASER